MNEERKIILAITTGLSSNVRYQKFMMALFSLIWIELSYLCMVGSFVFMNPIFWCQGVQQAESTACNNLSQCKIVNDYTATYYAELYCESQSQREAIQSIYSLGVLMGMLLIPMLADWKGRKRVFLASQFGLFLGALLIAIGVSLKNVVLMMVGQALNGSFTAGLVVLTYVLTAQLCEDRVRQLAMLMYNGMWGLSEASFILIYYFMPEWYNFMLLLVVIPLAGMAIVGFFYVIQSPIYCIFTLRDITKYESILRKLSIFNTPSQVNFDASLQTGREVLKSLNNSPQSRNQKSVKAILIDLLTTKQYIIAIILLVFLMSGYNISYFGSMMCMERTGFNFGITMVVIGLSQFACNLIMGYFIHRIPRKIGLFVSIASGTVFGLLFILPSIHESQAVQTLIVPFYRITSLIFYTFVIMLQTESFDSTVKSTAIGLLSSLSKVVNILIPFLITSMNDRGIHPIVACSILAAGVSILPAIFIKQTNKSIKSTSSKSINEDIEKHELYATQASQQKI